MSEAGPAANTTTAGATSEASARLSAVPRVTGSRIIWVDGCEASGLDTADVVGEFEMKQAAKRENFAATTTQSDRTALWDTAHQRPKASFR